MTPYSRRPAMPAEKARVFAGYKCTVGVYVASAWGWDEKWQRENFWVNHPLAEFEIIEVGSALAGGLHVVADPDDLHLRMIFVLPEFQNRGIGTALIREIQTAAHQGGKGLRLKVISHNPAAALYARLGFKLMDESDSSLNLRWV